MLAGLPPYVLSALTFIAILWLTLAPKPLGDNAPELFPGADKVVHGIMFWGFATMMLLDYQRKREWHKVSLLVIAMAVMISFSVGLAVEYAQWGMAVGRGFEEGDIVADGIGALAAGTGW